MSKKTTTKKDVTVRTGTKAGGWQNHSETVRVKTGVKAGGWSNHSESV